MHTRQQVYQKVPQFLALVIVGSINKVVKKKGGILVDQRKWSSRIGPTHILNYSRGSGAQPRNQLPQLIK
jgi:hypothetical protein